MRVVLVIPDLVGGGAETLTRYLAAGYRAHGFEVGILFSRRGSEETTQATRLRRLIGPIFLPGALRAKVKSLQADIVHAHTPWAGMQAVLECSFSCRARVVYTVHSRPSRQPPHLRMADYFATRFADIAVCVNSAWAAEVHGQNVATVSNGTPLVEAPKKTRRSHLLWIGRFAAEKQPELFINALSQDSHLQGMMVGGGPLEGRLIQLTKGLSNVDISGWTNEPGKLLMECAGLVFTSEFEGLSMIALEAMALGTPIVVPDLPEFRSIVPPAYPFVYHPNDVSHLLKKLNRLSNEPEVAGQVGEALRRHHESNFSIEKTVKEYVALLEAMI